MTPQQEETLLDQREAARYLGLRNQHTLGNWRHEGKGPPFIKLGRRCVRYRLSDLARYVEAQRVQPSRECSELDQIEAELKCLGQHIRPYGSLENTPEELQKQYAALCWRRSEMQARQEDLT